MIFVPLFQLFRMGAILAYLFAGIVIGPDGLALIASPKIILGFSELGVVFLLFLIGLELAPSQLWRLRTTIFGLGLSQVVVTGGLFMLIGRLFHLSWSVAFVAGFGLALSSTAFAMQILEEKRQLRTTHGTGSFAILMFQDLAVVPLLASLAFISGDKPSVFQPANLLMLLLFLVVLFLAAPRILRYLLRLIADSHNHEVFIATSLLIVVGSAYIMERMGLSMGLGAFLAGVILATSEYRRELETNLEPFKGLLLGLFFIAVGMSLNLKILRTAPLIILLLTAGFMATKIIVIYTLSRIFRFPKESSRNIAATVSQGGEFAFVLFNAADAYGLIDLHLSSILSASVILSMALTPLIFAANERWLRTFTEITERPYDQIAAAPARVIIAGYGRFGQVVSRFLKAENISHTILEHSASQVDAARKFGNKIFYGDASRADILRASGAATAEAFVLAIDDPDKSIQTARLVRAKFPHLKIIARARNRRHAISLMELGVENIHRETLLTSLEVAKEVVLAVNGTRREDINQRLAKFRQTDEKILRRQFELRNDEKAFVSFTIQANQELHDLLQADREAREADSEMPAALT